MIKAMTLENNGRIRNYYKSKPFLLRFYDQFIKYTIMNEREKTNQHVNMIQVCRKKILFIF